MQPSSPPPGAPPLTGSPQPQPAWVRPPRLPRPHSRRNEPKAYLRERLSKEGIRARHKHRAPAVVAALTDAGRTGSTLRRLLKANKIDPKQARLVLLYEGARPLRVAEVAWSLNISPSTASRGLDRAEREGLVDKFYDSFDRRGTWTRLTSSGVELRVRAQSLLETISTNARPAGVVYGIRSSRGWDE